MSKLNYISIEYKNNYAIIRYEANDDCWNEKLLLEIQDACQMIQADQKCLSVLFISNSKNSGFGWSKNFYPLTQDCKAILNATLIAVDELSMPSFFLMQGVTNLPAMEIALACDIRFALNDASISFMNQTTDAVRQLPRRVGHQHAGRPHRRHRRRRLPPHARAFPARR